MLAKKLKILSIVILAVSLCKTLQAGERTREIKTLVLIVASDDFPIYIELQKFWRRYMHSDPDHIVTYFVKSNPTLSSKVEVIGDTIWCRTPDGFCYENCGIIMKTMYAFEHFSEQIKNEFDYVVRTNLSTFCSFSRLLDYLTTLPKTGCYSGTEVDGVASGTGIILSPDVVEFLVRHKNDILNNLPNHFLDDVTIGRFLQSHGIRFIPHNFRIGIYNINDWEAIKNTFPPKTFQVHIKTDEHRPPRLCRILTDLVIHTDLFNMFYH